MNPDLMFRPGDDPGDFVVDGLPATLSDTKPQALKFLPVRDLLERPAPITYIVRKVIPTGSLGAFVGETASLKTTLVLGMVAAVTTSTKWFGKSVTHKPVKYILGEGFGGIPRRMKALERYFDISLAAAPLYFSTCASQMTEDAGLVEVMEAVDAIGAPPGMIVLDTVHRNFGAGDENSAADMGRFITNADHLRNRYGCTVLLVHHVGHTAKDRGRGSSAFRAALDFEYLIERPTPDIVRMICTKMKEAEPTPPMAFTLKRVPLPWADEDGAPEFGIVLVETDDIPEPETSGLGHNQEAVLTLFTDMYGKRKATLEAGGYDPSGARVATSELREASGMERRAFAKLKDRLALRNLIRIDAGFIYPGTV